MRAFSLPPSHPGGQDARAEASTASLPGAPVCRPSHRHAVLHLRGDRHAGTLQHLSPGSPLLRRPRSLAVCTLARWTGQTGHEFSAGRLGCCRAIKMKKTWPCRREPVPARAGLRSMSEEAGFRALPTPNLCLRGAN